MLGLEPPKTIYVPAKVPRRASLDSSTRSIGSSWGSVTVRRLTGSSKSFDYMQAPTSLASDLQPIFPWEKEEDVKERIGQSHTPSHPRGRPRHAQFHQHLLALVLFVTLALAAGTLLDGDASSNNDAKVTKTSKKKRGQYLPAASSKQDGISIAREMHEAYLAMKEDYHTKTFNRESQSRWKVLNERDGAKVSLLEHPSDPTCPYVRMETVIPTSVRACWEFLGIHNWHWSMPKMDPFYKNHDVFNDHTYQGVNMILVRKKTHRILAFGKRDFVFLSVTDEPLADGTYVSGSVSVETPDVPREAQYTRAFQDSLAFYKPVIDEGTGEEQCHLIIVCRIDLNDSTENGSGGFMPMWLYVKSVGATGIKSVLKMKDALMQMKKEQADTAEAGNLSEAPTSAFSQEPTATPPTPALARTAIRLERPAYRILATDQGNKIDTSTMHGSTASTWRGRPRGGAFVVPPPVNSSVPESPVQRWKPLYQMFTHIAPLQGPQPMPKNASRGLGVKWLQRLPLFGIGKRGKTA